MTDKTFQAYVKFPSAVKSVKKHACNIHPSKAQTFILDICSVKYGKLFSNSNTLGVPLHPKGVLRFSLRFIYKDW